MPNESVVANASAKPKGDRVRIPMSAPTRRLEVPDISGYHTHWFLESRVPRAIQGGYEFVNDMEVPVAQRGIGTSTDISGNVDMGTQVRQIAGIGENGKPEHLILMKIREEWWLEDKAAIDNRTAQTMAAIFQNESILGSDRDSVEDRGRRYIDKSRTKALFMRPARK
jgi:hypothetical protein